jgi:hypothetical protein
MLSNNCHRLLRLFAVAERSACCRPLEQAANAAHCFVPTAWTTAWHLALSRRGASGGAGRGGARLLRLELGGERVSPYKHRGAPGPGRARAGVAAPGRRSCRGRQGGRPRPGSLLQRRHCGRGGAARARAHRHARLPDECSRFHRGRARPEGRRIRPDGRRAGGRHGGGPDQHLRHTVGRGGGRRPFAGPSPLGGGRLGGRLLAPRFGFGETPAPAPPPGRAPRCAYGTGWRACGTRRGGGARRAGARRAGPPGAPTRARGGLCCRSSPLALCLPRLPGPRPRPPALS